MKLGVFAIVLGAGIAQVAAQPIRLVIVTSAIQDSPLEGLRFGHGVEQPPAVGNLVKGGNPLYKTMGTDGPKMHRPCGGRGRGGLSRLRDKGIEISNAFREALGWPLIETPNKAVDIKMIHSGADHAGPPSKDAPHNPPHHHNHHGHKHHHKHHGKHGEAFMTRLHYSLMNLGAWEGRAVAFVLGCGIGVLLRMFFVLAVVTYRAFKGRREEEHEYSRVITIEEYEAAAPLPPYSYAVDEKVEIVTVETPAEESK